MSDGMTILVAEDNRDDLEILDHCLARTSVEVILHTARDGQQLVDYLRDHRGGDIQLILLDLNMPIKDGREALRELRASGNKVPVVVLTTSADPADIEESYAAGANAYFVKPHNPQEFTELLGAILPHWERAKRPVDLQA